MIRVVSRLDSGKVDVVNNRVDESCEHDTGKFFTLVLIRFRRDFRVGCSIAIARCGPFHMCWSSCYRVRDCLKQRIEEVSLHSTLAPRKFFEIIDGRTRDFLLQVTESYKT